MQKKRIVSIDFGLARLGLAISDENQIIASPLKVILAERTVPKTIETILTALAPYKIEKIVIGNPLKLNNQNGTLHEHIQNFLKLLQEKVPYSVITFDERFTTIQAEQTLKMAQLNRKKRSEVIDAVAATLLLQTYLDFLCR